MSDLGKESIFLGVSKSETESNGKDKTKDTKFKTAYAFYRYHKLAKLNGFVLFYCRRCVNGGMWKNAETMGLAVRTFSLQI